MSIRKRTWGNEKEAWQVDLHVRGKRIREQFATKAEARAFELEVRTQAKAGTYLADSSKLTLRDIIPKYEEHIRTRNARGKEMTRQYMLHLIANLTNYIIGDAPIKRHGKIEVFKHGIANYKLFDLTPKIIEKFYDNIFDMGRTAKTVRGVANTLHSVLEFARLERYIVVNPAVGVTITEGRNAKSARKITPPSKAFVAALLKEAGERDALDIAFAALTGARAGEQRALRWKNLDLVHGTVTIETRVDRWGDEDGQGAKSDAGNRTVPISTGLVQALLEWRSETPYGSDDDLVFPGRKGKPRNHESHTRGHFANHCLRIILKWPPGTPRPSKPRWHDLRHFAISTWIEAGLPLKAVQEFAGHSDPALTLRVYGHLFPSEDHRTKMDLIAEGVLKSNRSSAFENVKARIMSSSPDILDVRFSAETSLPLRTGVHVTVDTKLELCDPSMRNSVLNMAEAVLSQLGTDPAPTSLTLRMMVQRQPERLVSVLPS